MTTTLHLLLLTLAPHAGEDLGAAAVHLPLGERLIGERQCNACHAADEAALAMLVPKLAPTLDGVGARVAPGWVEAFLLDPHAERPGTTMPDQLASLPEAERGTAARELAHFLAQVDGPFHGEARGTSWGELERGRRLFHSSGCVACHAPQEEPWELELSLQEAEAQRAEESGDEEPLPFEGVIPDGTLTPRDLPLDHLAAKTERDALAAFLLDPLAVRPSGHMPNMELADDEAQAIASYLLRAQLVTEPAPTAGLRVDVLHGGFAGREDLNGIEAAEQTISAQVDLSATSRREAVGLRFTGSIEVPADGDWTFWTASDDGSWLWIDGERIVDNGGTHPTREREGTVQLTAGKHAFEVHFYEQGGGESLKAEWRGPGVERQVIPAEVFSHQGLGLQGPPTIEPDPETAQRGARRFQALGCMACHRLDPRMPLLPGTKGNATLAELASNAGGSGCITPADGQRPRWPLEPAQLEAVRASLATLAQPAPELSAGEASARHLERMGCAYCHRRDGAGGVHPLNRDYYLAAEGADLGDEGRIPPHLDGVGSKLRQEAITAALVEGARVRPYMTARMPQFGDENVGWMAGAFHEADPELTWERTLADGAHLMQGLRLIGTEGGLGCIQCHDFAGTPSLGIRAVDLSTVARRIRPGWFHQLLKSPGSVNMNTRMAELWTDGRSPVTALYEGDPEPQIEAIWQVLQLGEGMPPPPGLNSPEAAFELSPINEVITCGVFWGGLSPRTLAVGFPELVHYAYDMQESRLGALWKGRFFNARGTWQGRAGSLEGPAGSQVVSLPEGMLLARLPDASAAWPAATGREAGVRARGRRQALGEAPEFHSSLGELDIHETLTPIARDGRTGFLREIALSSKDATAVEDVVARLLTGEQAVQVSDGHYRVQQGEREVHLVLVPTSDARGPAVGLEQGEVRLPVQFSSEPVFGGGEVHFATLAVEVTW